MTMIPKNIFEVDFKINVKNNATLVIKTGSIVYIVDIIIQCITWLGISSVDTLFMVILQNYDFAKKL